MSEASIYSSQSAIKTFKEQLKKGTIASCPYNDYKLNAAKAGVLFVYVPRPEFAAANGAIKNVKNK